MESRPEHDRRVDLNKLPCPICGQAYYEWGYPKESHGTVRFSDKRIDWMTAGEKMRARKAYGAATFSCLLRNECGKLCKTD